MNAWKGFCTFSFCALAASAMAGTLPTTHTVDDDGGADFTTIQAAINAATSGDIIEVAAGTYVENVVTTISLTINGPFAGVPGNDVSRGTGEAIVIPADNNSGDSNVFSVLAGNTTINGFTIDGDNPSLSGGRSLNGVDVNAARGVSNYWETPPAEFSAFDALEFDNMDVVYNRIVNFNEYGVTAFNGENSNSTNGSDWSWNYIDNVPAITPQNGRGLGPIDNWYGTMNNNVIERCYTGIQTNNTFNAPASPPEIRNNTINSYANGIVHNLMYQDTGDYFIEDNTISSDDFNAWTVDGNPALELFGIFTPFNINNGIFLISVDDNANPRINDNILDNNRRGITMWNVEVDGDVQVRVTGGSITNSTQYGIYAFNRIPGQFGPNPVIATVDNVTISGSAIAGIRLEDNITGALSDTDPVDITILDETTISNNPTGVSVFNALSTAKITQTTITGGNFGVDASSSATVVICATNFDTITTAAIQLDSTIGSDSKAIYNNFNDAAIVGLDNNAAFAFNARSNWWGDASGPSGTGPGSGAEIIGLAEFTPFQTAPITDWDLDRDGLLICDEDVNGNQVVDAGESDPNNIDTDGDGFEDFIEVAAGFDPTNGSEIIPDADGDGTPDNIDPGTGADFDNDLYKDFYEIILGFDPNDNTNFPAIGDISDPVGLDAVDGVDLFRVFLGIIGPNDVPRFDEGDINRDGVTDNVDGVLIFNVLLGNIEALPFP